MTEPSELFFIEAIDRGLGSADQLTPEEREMLLTPVSAAFKVMTPGYARALQERCFKALSASYQKETAGKNVQLGAGWRKFNVWLYRDSKAVISGIVQNWYLSEGRELEKRAFLSPIPAILIGLLVLVAVIILATVLRR